MPESPMVGARVPKMWQQQISAIATASGRREAEIVREALAKYLGKTDPSAVKGAIASLEHRLAIVKQKLSGLGRLVG